MRKRIISILLFACVVTGIGVVQIMHSKGSEKQTEQTVTNQPIAFGSVYEITENNFVKGLDHDFTQEELEIWNEVYQDGSVQEEQGYLLDGAQKYMIHLYDADGNLHRLAEFIGKYILLDFWSAGCGPCVQAIPELQEIARKYAGRVAVVSISQDPKPVWKEFIAEKQLVGNQWNELVDGDTGLGMRYGVKEIPHFVLIAPDVRIQDVWQGYGKGSLLEKMEQNIK